MTDAPRPLVDELTGALRFIMAFYEPGQTYLDTNAWKVAEAGGRSALAKGEAFLSAQAAAAEQEASQSLRSGNGGEVRAWWCEHGDGSIEVVMWPDARDKLAAQGYEITPLSTPPVGAETGEPVAAKRLTDKDMRDGMPCDWPACGCDFDAKCSDAPPRSDKANGERPTGHFTIEHDGFSGTVIGHYERLDGKRGVVMQQDGTKVVHVYGEKWLSTSPAVPNTVGEDKQADLVDRLKLEAQIHAGEARAANSTINEIYQIISGGTGEPGNWNGAEPVRAYVASSQALVQSMREALENIRELNFSGADENGNQWANSDLIDQEITAALSLGAKQ